MQRIETVRSREHTRGAARAVVQTPCHLCYRCGTCGAGFATEIRLAMHLQHAYHGFQCLTCGALYATRNAFALHLKRAHGQDLTGRSA